MCTTTNNKTYHVSGEEGRHSFHFDGEGRKRACIKLLKIYLLRIVSDLFFATIFCLKYCKTWFIERFWRCHDFLSKTYRFALWKLILYLLIRDETCWFCFSKFLALLQQIWKGGGCWSEPKGKWKGLEEWFERQFQAVSETDECMGNLCCPKRK